jgi:transcriptional regulator with XRE-family HTH domain
MFGRAEEGFPEMAGAIRKVDSRNSRNDRLHAGLDYPEQLGARLRQLRKQRGLTQKDVAEQLGVSTPALCRWETGQTLPRKSNIEAFANVFNLSEVELLAAVSGDAHSASVASMTDRRATGRAGVDLATASEPSLRDVLLACKRNIAEAAGTTADRIRIVIDV